MTKFIERYSNETEKIERYEYMEVLEIVKVKNQSFEVLHEYYKRLSDGELFEPFDNPDKNLEKDYEIYRKKNNLLNPNHIRAIREKYKLSVRDFSNILGISYGNLSSIENGSIQPKYIDSLIRLASDPQALEKLLIARKNDVTEGTYETLIARINDAFITTFQEYSDFTKKTKSVNLASMQELIKMTKRINYNLDRNKGGRPWENFTMNSSTVSSRKLTYN